jgi:hypothetical protein
MTTPIRIPVHISDGTYRWHCHAEVTPEIARQIAALAEPFLGVAHQAGLEQAHQAKPVDAGPAEPVPVNDLLTLAANPPQGYVPISPPADDEAAIEAIRLACVEERKYSDRGITETTIAAIKAGKVPGLHCMPHLEQHLQRQCNDIAAKDAALAKRHLQVKEMHGQIAALRAQLAEATRERDRALDEAGRATVNASNHAADAETVRRDRDDLRAQLAEAKADAERAKAERNKNEAQWVEMQRAGDIRHLRKLTQEANEARAEVERLTRVYTLSEKTAFTYLDERDRLAAEVERLKGRKVTLPLLRHIKSRAVSDYTFSEHAEGWDDAVHEMAQWLDLVGIPYDEPQACTVETLRAAGLEVAP